jgi:hypothetical protein
VSALGYYLEDEGIATTIISLIRVHSEKVRAPRNLFVPYELGRPLGAPNDSDTQKRVLKAALDLLVRDDGPCVIEDFDDDSDYQAATSGWVNPAADIGGDVDTNNIAATRAAVQAEVTALKPLFDQAVAESGRDPVGISGLSMDQIVDYIPAFLGDPPDSLREDMSGSLLMRYAADDLKAYYLQAASAGDVTPSSVQLTDWFWQQTAAAKVLIALREKWKDSDNKGLKMVCGSFMVPHMQVHGLGL